MLTIAAVVVAAAGTSLFCSSPAATATAPRCRGDAGPPGIAVPDAGFCIDGTEVTNAQYAAFARSQTPAGLGPSCAWKTSFAPTLYGRPERPDDPVGGVDWCDAFAFCAWAGKRLCGRIGGGALATAEASSPTASEWTAACSRSGERAFPYGPTYDPSLCTTTIDAATPAGATCEGGYDGVFDMSGNIQEWEDACDVADDGGALDLCSSRGGDWNDDSAIENACAGNHVITRATRADHLGIRCCATP
jgi:formylglycine-generating enzyme required for sulfatase activity